MKLRECLLTQLVGLKKADLKAKLAQTSKENPPKNSRDLLISFFLLKFSSFHKKLRIARRVVHDGQRNFQQSL